MRSLEQPADLAMLSLLALLLLCNGVGNVNCSTVHENSVDLHALLDFKQDITSDPKGALSNWKNGTHFCRWDGVICTEEHRPLRVFALNLTGQNLEGQITSFIGNLTFLSQLDLSHNSFADSFPILNRLQQLQSLFVNNNNLTGISPYALSNCSSLLYLDFSSNLLAGAFPPKVGFPTNLLYINFKSNQLEGIIPDEIGKLPKLQDLLLGNNKLSGDFPHAILNLSASLQYLNLEFNMLGNAIPPNIGDLLGLKFIDLSHNSFTGLIPSSIGNLTQLTHLYLNDNEFEGLVPAWDPSTLRASP